MKCIVAELTLMKAFDSCNGRSHSSAIPQRSDLTQKERLISLELLPLSSWLVLHDVLFLVKQMKNPSDNFNLF